MRIFLMIGFWLLLFSARAQKTVSSDKNWAAQSAELTGGRDAEHIIRIGDVDNLNFGWPEDFDPFCGATSVSHPWPTEINPRDVSGFDRIILSSKYQPGQEQRCGGDGYSESYDPKSTKPVVYKIPTTTIKNVTIKNAFLQLFMDDFQAPTFCSKYTITINGKRFNEGERILNAIDQSGPVGKLISLLIPEEFYDTLRSGQPLNLYIDETTGAADGFAIDFIRLLVNRTQKNLCIGDLSGRVLDKETSAPIKDAIVKSEEGTQTTTNAEGKFTLRGLPTGFYVITASAKEYNDGNAEADVSEHDSPEIEITLERGRSTALFGDKKINVGESVTLSTILFDQGKSDLRASSYAELDKIAAFLLANPKAEIELSGHTSAEGDPAPNRSLSYRRVKACQNYLASKGIASERVIIVGYGPDRPVAPNDTETNRMKNRRVEMRVVKI